MKIIIKIFLIQFFGIITLSHSQWLGDVRLTNNSADQYTSFNNAFCVASSGNYVHAVWYDLRHEGGVGNSEIYYRRSTDGGATWGSETRLTNAASNSDSPTLAAAGSVVHLVWRERRDNNYEIYYKRSEDNGSTWTADTRITFTAEASINPAFTISGQVIHAVWEEEPVLFNTEVYYKHSTNAGISWDSSARLTNVIGDSDMPSVAASGLNVHITWTDNRTSPDEIYYIRSTNGGSSWESEVLMSLNDLRTSQNSMISSAGSDVHLVWMDGRQQSGYMQLCARHSTNSGVTWGPDTLVTTFLSNKFYPSFVKSGSYIHAIWEDRRDGNPEIYYKLSTNNGINWGTDTRLTNNSAISEFPSLAVNGSALHLVWRDLRDGNREIYYKGNPTGNPSGIINIGSEIPGEFSLSQNYPNPFNPVTNIEFSVPKSGHVTLSVFDILGREVATLVNEKLSAGTYRADFDASHLTSGVYFYRLTSVEGFTSTRKMILVK